MRAPSSWPAIVVASGLPWFAAELGFHLADTPVLRSIFLAGVSRPEPGSPDS